MSKQLPKLPTRTPTTARPTRSTSAIFGDLAPSTRGSLANRTGTRLPDDDGIAGALAQAEQPECAAARRE